MTEVPRIYIKETHHEPGSDDLTGLKFTVEFGRATALVTAGSRTCRSSTAAKVGMYQRMWDLCFPSEVSPKPRTSIVTTR